MTLMDAVHVWNGAVQGAANGIVIGWFIGRCIVLWHARRGSRP